MSSRLFLSKLLRRSSGVSSLFATTTFSRRALAASSSSSTTTARFSPSLSTLSTTQLSPVSPVSPVLPAFTRPYTSNAALVSSALKEFDQKLELETPPSLPSLLDNFAVSSTTASTDGTDVELVELPHHENLLGTDLEGCYVRTSDRPYGTPETVLKAVSAAYAWTRHLKLNPMVLIGDMSPADLSESECSECSESSDDEDVNNTLNVLNNNNMNESVMHYDGKQVDFHLARTLPSDRGMPDSNVDKYAQFCALLINVGATRVFFNDALVMHAVNQWAEEKHLQGRVEEAKGIKSNYFHVEF